MDWAMTYNWLDSRRADTLHARFTKEAQAVRLARENARLIEENERLQRKCADLAASAGLWIRLYEEALKRANGRFTARDGEMGGSGVQGFRVQRSRFRGSRVQGFRGFGRFRGFKEP
jgi:hypothetical protein